MNPNFHYALSINIDHILFGNEATKLSHDFLIGQQTFVWNNDSLSLIDFEISQSNQLLCDNICPFLALIIISILLFELVV